MNPIADETIIPIEYHADDFGLFQAQSKRILDCHDTGVLNGVSVMPNSDCLGVCMALLRPVREKVAVTVHLNFMEGRSLCEAGEVPLLAAPNGVFRATFGRLLLHSFLPDRNAYRDQLKKEIRAQIDTMVPYLGKDAPMRIDGHAHYHMLPVVFDALMEVIREEKLNVSYIRVPRERLSLYLPHWRRLKGITAINWIKVLILNLLAERNLRKYRDYMESLDQKVFLGVFLSGHMYRENVAQILPGAIQLADGLHQGLEILAHPGGVYEPEDIAKLTNQNDILFMTSDSRREEALLYSLERKEIREKEKAAVSTAGSR